MPSDRQLLLMNRLHHGLLRATGNRVGKRISGMPVLELTTIGRKSGQPRTVLLTAPIRNGDEYVVVASRGGGDKHPAWLLNVQVNPSVTVAFAGSSPTPMRARVVGADERAHLWPKVVSAYKGYGRYQAKTEREIPLVILSPEAD